MSQFSESYHLRSERAEDAGELLRRLGLSGFVYPVTAGWVTFVAEGGNFAPNPQIARAARQPLLHYVSTGDHGWSFVLFENGSPISAYSCEWTDDISFDDTRYSRAALQRCVPSLSDSELDGFERYLAPDNIDDILDAEPAKRFALMLGLVNYEWLDYDGVAFKFQASPDEFAAVTKIN